MSPTPPRGREAVAEALLEAAAELFARRGTHAVSLREVAKHAGVNHGLVHRHFGNKKDLVRATMSWLAERIAEGLAAKEATAAPMAPKADGLLEAVDPRYLRILAHAMLAADDIAELQHSFPVLRRAVASAEKDKAQGQIPKDVDPRIAVAVEAATWLGWLLFEPYLLAAVGLDKVTRKWARQQAFRLVRARARGR